MSYNSSVSVTTQYMTIAQSGCWDWDAGNILTYIDNRINFVNSLDCNLTNEAKAAAVEVATDMLKYCITKQTPAIILKNNGERDVITINAPLYREIVPITDVFTAFGWFVSVTDLSQNRDMISDPYWNFRCLCNFARLCRAIAYKTFRMDDESDFFRYNLGVPTMVHLLYTANFEFPIIAFEGTADKASFLISLSNSLPSVEGEPWAKKRMLLKRKNSNPEFAANLGPLPQKKWDFGSCAETLNVLGLMNRTKHIYVYGAATEIVSTFISAPQPPAWNDHNVRTNFKMNVARNPCDNCGLIVKKANMTFMDFGKRVVYGPYPPDHNLGNGWTSEWLCYSTKCSERPKTKFNCNLRHEGCRASWCGSEHKDSDSVEHFAHYCCGIKAQAAGSSTGSSAIATTASTDFSFIPFDTNNLSFPAFVRKTPPEPIPTPAAQRVVPGSAPRAQTSQGRGKSPR